MVHQSVLPAAVLLCSGTIECYYILMTHKVNKYWNVFITKISLLQMQLAFFYNTKTENIENAVLLNGFSLVPSLA